MKRRVTARLTQSNAVLLAVLQGDLSCCHAMAASFQVSSYSNNGGWDRLIILRIVFHLAVAEVAHLSVSCLTATWLQKSHLIPDVATNRRIGVSQAGYCIAKCAVPKLDFKPCVQSASISWWMLKIPRFVS